MKQVQMICDDCDTDVVHDGVPDMTVGHWRVGDQICTRKYYCASCGSRRMTVESIRRG